MKANHEAKVDEIKISQESEIEKVQDDHQDHLETARQKYEAEINKLEA
jgi:hypothetical protein